MDKPCQISPARNLPKSYPAKFDLYVFIQDERVIISYCDKTENNLSKLLKDIKIGDKPEHMFNVIKEAYCVSRTKILNLFFII